MKEDKINVKIDSEIKYNRRHMEKEKTSDNKDCNYELFKYKRSLYLIRKAIKLIKNHYHNKINKVDTLRIRQRKKLFYLEKGNIILEDKCNFYSEHVEELKNIYTEQLNLKNDKIQNLQDEINKMRGNYDDKCESNTIRILKLREDQIERLSEQLNTINNLYHKQVDNNKKLIKEIEDLNKSILYLNNKVQEEKNNTEDIKKKFKFYKRYNRNRKKFKLNFEIINQHEEKQKIKENDDICLSILCLLKTELETIDSENKNEKTKEQDQKRFRIKNHSFFKKILESNYKYKKSNIFDHIYKKQFFSFYEEKFTENDKVKFQNKKIFSFPLNYKKKLNKYNNIHNLNKRNVEKTNDKNKEILNEGDKWKNLSLSNIYFYNNFNDNFDNNSEYFNRKRDIFDKNCEEEYDKNNYEYNDKSDGHYMYYDEYDNMNNNKNYNKKKNKKKNDYKKSNEYNNKTNINYNNISSSEYSYITDNKINNDKSDNECINDKNNENYNINNKNNNGHNDINDNKINDDKSDNKYINDKNNNENDNRNNKDNNGHNDLNDYKINDDKSDNEYINDKNNNENNNRNNKSINDKSNNKYSDIFNNKSADNKSNIKYINDKNANEHNNKND
ncbi:conserved Plasmodium protein, unknown function [Plasmodium relictum]|uniref:Uncharacterized protein n=1 Tax=Plasmodium relictum TaxID=85471 RepID=A0A1J1HC40_PLARL|nr:conserved Plasmodium protein, unknown function [Plasmodium relictum]CRH02871.1 conserved Plasmodium protein, unknown function [Plasmodium relictum]